MKDERQRDGLVDILLVEDNPADVNMLRESFRESKIGNELHVVNDGERALDFLHQRGAFTTAPRPDLVLLDIGLPKMSGLDVLAEIKADPDLRRIPVIILTTSESEEDVFKSYDLHANSFITKPVHLTQLFELLKTIEDFWFGIVKLPSR